MKRCEKGGWDGGREDVTATRARVLAMVLANMELTPTWVGVTDSSESRKNPHGRGFVTYATSIGRA